MPARIFGVNMYLSKSRAGQTAAVTPLLSVLRGEQLAAQDAVSVASLACRCTGVSIPED